MELPESNEAAALLDLIGPGNAEALRISEDARILLLHQNALLSPCLEVACRARVDTFAALRIEKFRQAEDNADEVVRAALVIRLLHRRRDLVIRLGHHILQPDC